RAVERANAADALPERHVGWHLLGCGVRNLERDLRYRPTWRHARQRWLLDHPGTVYFGTLLAITALFVAACTLVAPGPLTALLVAAVVLLPASELAVGLTNYLMCRLVPPRVLPKLEFKGPIPEEYATFLVIPTLLTRPEGVPALLERLELHYL